VYYNKILLTVFMILLLLMSFLFSFLFFPEVFPSSLVIKYHPSAVRAVEATLNECPCCLGYTKRQYSTDDIIRMLRHTNVGVQIRGVIIISYFPHDKSPRLLRELVGRILVMKALPIYKYEFSRAVLSFDNKDTYPYIKKFLESSDPDVRFMGLRCMYKNFPDKMKYLREGINCSNGEIRDYVVSRCISLTDEEKNQITPLIVTAYKKNNRVIKKIFDHYFEYFDKLPQQNDILLEILKDPETTDHIFCFTLAKILSRSNPESIGYGKSLFSLIRDSSPTRKGYIRKILSEGYPVHSTILCQVLSIEDHPVLMDSKLPQQELNVLFLGLTPLDYATLFGDKSLADFLLKNGCKTATELINEHKGTDVSIETPYYEPQQALWDSLFVPEFHMSK